MILWKRCLNPYITALPPKSSSFLGLLFQPPCCPPSLHVSIYLPTSGKESEFVREITMLRELLEEVTDASKADLIYIRGDSNVNDNHSARRKMLKDFMDSQNLIRIPFSHKTYHHFVGNGRFDSNIDVILQSKNKHPAEVIESIYCKNKYPIIDSHHDIIISKVDIPLDANDPKPVHDSAPVIENNRKRILWSENHILDYQMVLSDSLACLRSRWLDPSSVASVSILLKVTSDILNSAAEATNKSISLSKPRLVKSAKIPKVIRKMNKSVMKKARRVDFLSRSNPTLAAAAREELNILKSEHRKLVRKHENSINVERDQKVFSILSSNPSAIFARIKSIKATSTDNIPFLTVGDKVFYGENVKDGFFESIKNLKTKDNDADLRSNNWANINVMQDYNHILDICKTKVDLPPISIADSTKILLKMKKSVSDFYSVTTLHYINAGEAGIQHFNFLLNCIIEDVNNASVEELNTVYALLLHKGHNKSKTSDKSYRTISTCPVISKALDLYIRDLNINKWKSQQAITQYQGENSSHDLAALLVTEVIQRSIFTLRKPVYLLFLDAKSAFDVVIPELLIRNMFLAGMDGNSILLMNQRLRNRHTYIDWNRTIMGPILDDHGLEQGGGNSSDLYKLYNNNLLKSTQLSQQGVDLGNNLVISSIGLADDTVLASNTVSSLWNILYLTLIYCEKYGVSLCPTKTKLLKLSSIDSTNLETFNPIKIQDKNIEFSDVAEHVGILRSVDGNIPHIMQRISSHKKSLGAILSVGVSRSHRANPMAGLRIERIYATPVLLSGLASLVLSESEISIIDIHYKETVQNIQKLLKKKPRCVVYFLGGCLPLKALLHIRQLTIFGMVTRLPGNPLQIHARYILSQGKPVSRSWFWKIRDICLQYSLVHPLSMLDNPPAEAEFRKVVKSQVISYWERKLRGEASQLVSLAYFRPDSMSLCRPHPIWRTTGSNPYEVTKAIQQARFLSGRYRTESLASHWSDNPQGYCRSKSCVEVAETVEHILISCQAYEETRKVLTNLWMSTPDPNVLPLVVEALNSGPNYLLQFILDCSVLPTVIRVNQKYGCGILSRLFYLTRTWCYAIHRKRMKMLGRWNFV